MDRCGRRPPGAVPVGGSAFAQLRRAAGDVNGGLGAGHVSEVGAADKFPPFLRLCVRRRALGATYMVMSDTPTEADLPETVTPHPLHLTVDPWWDTLHCLAFGIVSDAPIARSGDLIFVLEDPEAGPVLGFEILGLSEFELPEEDREIWDGPRFAVPRLGLVDASAGEIILAVRAQFGDDPTADALHFHTALAAECAEDALPHWELALDAGDMRAHFGLGYALVEAGRADRGYAHLRRYTELAPVNAWAWCWLGQCCEALGRASEAKAAYERAIAVEELCGLETDSAERLEQLSV